MTAQRQSHNVGAHPLQLATLAGLDDGIGVADGTASAVDLASGQRLSASAMLNKLRLASDVLPERFRTSGL
jgi:hypothetical protein